jgi:hypothetical protein
MKKVTIEITAEGWKTTVELDGKTYVENHVLTNSGSKGDSVFEEEPKISEELYDALQSSGAFDISVALNN